MRWQILHLVVDEAVPPLFLGLDYLLKGANIGVEPLPEEQPPLHLCEALLVRSRQNSRLSQVREVLAQLLDLVEQLRNRIIQLALLCGASLARSTACTLPLCLPRARGGILLLEGNGLFAHLVLEVLHLDNDLLLHVLLDLEVLPHAGVDLLVLVRQLLLELVLQADEVVAHGLDVLLAGAAAHWLLQHVSQIPQHPVQSVELVEHGVDQGEDEGLVGVDYFVLQLLHHVLHLLLLVNDLRARRVASMSTGGEVIQFCCVCALRGGTPLRVGYVRGRSQVMVHLALELLQLLNEAVFELVHLVLLVVNINQVLLAVHLHFGV